jgi:hypothetical protein
MLTNVSESVEKPNVMLPLSCPAVTTVLSDLPVLTPALHDSVVSLNQSVASHPDDPLRAALV